MGNLAGSSRASHCVGGPGNGSSGGGGDASTASGCCQQQSCRALSCLSTADQEDLARGAKAAGTAYDHNHNPHAQTSQDLAPQSPELLELMKMQMSIQVLLLEQQTIINDAQSNEVRMTSVCSSSSAALESNGCGVSIPGSAVLWTAPVDEICAAPRDEDGAAAIVSAIPCRIALPYPGREISAGAGEGIMSRLNPWRWGQEKAASVASQKGSEGPNGKNAKGFPAVIRGPQKKVGRQGPPL